MNGTDLLAAYRRTGADEPFHELVRRYTNLIYSVAKRRVSDTLLAQEVTQLVFIRLAKAVPKLRRDAELTAWLHRTTIHVSIDLWRSETRRHAREEEAAMQPSTTDDQTWKEMSPVLDEALNDLSDEERQTILLRFFEQRSMRELGAQFGISEDAAKMRVSRAVDHLRTRLQVKGVTCTAAAMIAVLPTRAVETAPAELVASLALLSPAASGLVSSGLLGALLHGGKAKVLAGATAVAVGAGALWVWQARLADASKRAEQPSQAVSVERTGITDLLRTNSEHAIASDNSTAPDPAKLLTGVARARLRITSGEMEFEVARYDFDPLEGTNTIQVKARFDGEKRRFETVDREYALVSTAPDAREVANAKRQANGWDKEAAVRAGLLTGFEMHHVFAYDGSVLLDYEENDGRPFQVKIQDPKSGGAYHFDPRCLGINVPLSNETVEDCLRHGTGTSIRLIGMETVAGAPSWHVSVRRNEMDSDFWIEVAHPTRVVKHTWNGSEVVSRYDDSAPDDPLPIETTEMFLHGTTGRNTAFALTHMTRQNSRYNTSVEPSSWTLAGLGMKIGTDVVDYRISRSLGYWNGAGFSENLPAKNGASNSPPDIGSLVTLLDTDPASTAAFDAAQWILLNTMDSPDVAKAGEVILNNHITSTNLLRLSVDLERMRHSCSSNLLSGMMEMNPEADIRGNACFSLATMRKEQANFGSNAQATAEAATLFERVISDFGAVKRGGATLASLAKPELYELRKLVLGKPAPETKGEDLEGNPLTLADARGKVVLLVFWGHCGGCRPDVSSLSELQKTMADGPFAIYGVYCDPPSAEVLEIAQKSGMTWPSFRDDRTGPISTAWNVNYWPASYLLDKKATIRFRDLRGDKLTAAVKALVSE